MFDDVFATSLVLRMLNTVSDMWGIYVQGAPVFGYVVTSTSFKRVHFLEKTILMFIA